LFHDALTPTISLKTLRELETDAAVNTRCDASDDLPELWSDCCDKADPLLTRPNEDDDDDEEEEEGIPAAVGAPAAAADFSSAKSGTPRCDHGLFPSCRPYRAISAAVNGDDGRWRGPGSASTEMAISMMLSWNEYSDVRVAVTDDDDDAIVSHACPLVHQGSKNSAR